MTAIYELIKWFDVWWWRYLLEAKREEVSWLTVLQCRVKGHPCGPIYFNPWGSAPNPYCKNCGDDIG